MNEATVLLLDHNRNEIMVRNDAFLVVVSLLPTEESVGYGAVFFFFVLSHPF
jgi:hypothetical protein